MGLQKAYAQESIAHSFEGVGLYEDALLIYEELEASFFQCIKERNITWSWRLGGTGPQDDSFHILDTSAKHYRDLLLGDLITVFDFRIYVFACQCVLLGKLGRITEIAKRGQWFIASLAGKLRSNLVSLVVILRSSHNSTTFRHTSLRAGHTLRAWTWWSTVTSGRASTGQTTTIAV